RVGILGGSHRSPDHLGRHPARASPIQFFRHDGEIFKKSQTFFLAPSFLIHIGSGLAGSRGAYRMKVFARGSPVIHRGGPSLECILRRRVAISVTAVHRSPLTLAGSDWDVFRKSCGRLKTLVAIVIAATS